MARTAQPGLTASPPPASARPAPTAGLSGTGAHPVQPPRPPARLQSAATPAKLGLMRGRHLSLFSWLVLLLAFVPAAVGSPATSLLICASPASEAEKADCLDRELAKSGSEELSALQEVLPRMPEAVLEVALRRTDRRGAGAVEGPVRASWLDLEGQALAELGRFDDAAARLGEAVALDDGTLRLSRVAPDGRERWRTSLDTGGGRLVRAARNLVSAGRSVEALPLLRRALALGEGGWVEQAWLEAGDGAVSGRSNPPRPLPARDWFKPVPDTAVELSDGKSFALRGDAQGRVMILSFWATWCQPCQRELPLLQELYESHRESGLEILAINVGEPMELAVSFAKGLGITFPVSVGSRELYDTFDTSRLPLTAVVDRWGSVRGRWAGFEPGDEDRLVSMTRRLLAEQGPPSRDVAEVLLGNGLLEIAWMRPGPGLIEGLALVPRSAGSAGVLVSAARSLALYDAEGQTTETWTAAGPIGELRASPPGPDGRAEALGFRAGGTDLVSITFPSGDRRDWSAPAPVFDAALAGPPRPEAAAPVLLATMGGLWNAAADGAPAARVPAVSAGASAVDCLAGEPAGGAVVLDFGGRIHWLGPALESEREASAPPGSWVLFGMGDASGDVGVAPSGLVAVATGRFLEGGGRQAALATDSGQLVLVDLRTGEAVFRARWDGITALAAGDLVNDGRDELLVGAGSEVGILRAR